MQRHASLSTFLPDQINTAVLHVASLAQAAVIHTRSWCADSSLARVRLAGQLEQARNEISQLREELRIKDARMRKIEPRHRPHYPPVERMAILELKASRGWNAAQTAKRFLVEPETICEWLKRVEDESLIKVAVPVNRFPGFVRHAVRRLKVLCPVMGKKRIAETLCRAGLLLSSTTIQRVLKESVWRPGPEESPPASAVGRIVTARHPNHVWHVDLTVVPTRAGFWAPWFPWCTPLCWPFCCWIAVAVDHFSRKAMGFAVYKTVPSSLQVRSFLGQAMGRVRTRPGHIICDRGRQFDCETFRKWCKRKKIRWRYGAVGKYGSIAIAERFIRSMKNECLRTAFIPVDMSAFRRELSLYFTWYN